MTKRTVYNGGKVITENEQVILTQPGNSWDTNYHAYDKDNRIEYLVDINDVVDTEEEWEDGGVLWEDFKQGDLTLIIENAWRAFDKDGEEIELDRGW